MWTDFEIGRIDRGGLEGEIVGIRARVVLGKILLVTLRLLFEWVLELNFDK